MRIRNYAFVLLVLLVGCKREDAKKSSSQADSLEIEQQHQAAEPVPTIKLDSINRVNDQSIKESDTNVTLAYVSYQDSSICLVGNMRADYRIFGYAKPDTKSEKLLLISIFTDDVDGNPFRCKFGAYYETSDMKNMNLKYKGTSGNFIKAVIIANKKDETVVYFEKKWIEFE